MRIGVKALAVAKSCQTQEQVRVAARYLSLADKAVDRRRIGCWLVGADICLKNMEEERLHITEAWMRLTLV